MANEDFHVEDDGSASVIVMTISTVTHDVNEALQKKVEELLGAGKKMIILDLAQTSYVSSLILASLVYMQKRTQEEGGNLVMCAVSTRLMEIIATTNLDKIFTIVGSRDEAKVKLG